MESKSEKCLEWFQQAKAREKEKIKHHNPKRLKREEDKKKIYQEWWKPQRDLWEVQTLAERKFQICWDHLEIFCV